MMEMETKELSLANFVVAMVKWRRLIIMTFLSFALVGLLIALILPRWYTSSATLLPPEADSQSGLGLLSLVADIPLNLPSFMGLGGTPLDSYIGILHSRNVRERVLKKLDLMEIWEEDSLEDALKMLEDLTEIEPTDEGFLIISATAGTRERAQKMAQAYIDELDRVNRTIRHSTAHQTKEFIEKRLADAEKDLRTAATTIRDFQTKHGVISLEEQTRASIEAAAHIQAEIVLKEVEYEILRTRLSASHEKVRVVKSNIDALQTQLNNVENAQGTTAGLLIPFSEIPDLGMQYVFLHKDVEVQKAIYQLLVQQYEQARIQEMRDTPTVQVLDWPHRPERKSKPKRLYIVLASGLLGLFVGGFTIAFNGYMERLRDRDSQMYQDVLSAYATLRGDFNRLIPWRR